MRTLIFFLLLSSTAFAAEVSRQEASSMIDEMVKSNMISAEEAAKAKARLQTMSASEWSGINSEAEKKVAESEGRAPASVDLADEQFQAIENDLKVIAPHTVGHQGTEVKEAVVPKTIVEEAVVEEAVVPHAIVEEAKVAPAFVPQT